MPSLDWCARDLLISDITRISMNVTRPMLRGLWRLQIRHGHYLSHKGESKIPENSETSPSPAPAHDSSLPFDRIRHSETFGQLVRSDHYETNSDPQGDAFVRKIRFSDGQPSFDVLPSPFRNEDGSFIQGNTADEARAHPLTLQARADHTVTKLPAEIAKVVNKNILLAVSPNKLRERAAEVFQSVDKEQMQKAPELSLDVDAHIAALFLQNYGHVHRVLSELFKKVPEFRPQSVLDVGYGPGTGMIALNEIMSTLDADWDPHTKEVYVVGRTNREMKRRAKILLSRQVNEIPKDVKNGAQEEHNAISRQPGTHAETEDYGTPDKEMVDSEMTGLFDKEGDYIGPVDASKIRVRTRLRDALPTTKQYELIMVNQSLLTREYNFPKDVDTNLRMLLRLLKPGGHLVLVERGNSLGFETIARARQVMIRPEAHEGQVGKVPRPYIQGSSIKPQKIRKEDQIITEGHVELERAMLAELEKEDAASELHDDSVVMDEALDFENQQYSADNISELERDILAKFGPLSEEDLKFEFENDTEISSKAETPSQASSPQADYHLSVVAPCPHHAKCPLQLGDPNLYKVSNTKHRLSFCSFNQVFERPKYTMELKKGKRLAVAWDKSAVDGFGTSMIKRSTLKNMQGTGRTGSGNAESGNLSYLIMRREKNDAASLAQIEEKISYANVKSENTHAEWPRILDFPAKIKNNVKLNVCSESGNVEVWQVPKSLGKQIYHDARKARQGDEWALGKKSVVVKNGLSPAKLENLKRLANTQRKLVVKEKRRREWKKVVGRSETQFEDPQELADSLATDMEQSKKYRTEAKRARYDVDLQSYEER